MRSSHRSTVRSPRGTGTREQILSNAWTIQWAASQSNRRLHDYYATVGVGSGSNGLPAERLDVRDGAYCLVPFHNAPSDAVVKTVVEFLIAHPGEFDCVVELGSGAGKNLFDLFQAAPELLKGKIDLHACELTDSGRVVIAWFQTRSL